MSLENEKEATLPTLEQYIFRIEHIEEELNELKEAFTTNDLVEIADALVDIVYVSVGACIEWGIPFDSVWAEVQKSNMSKQRAKPDGSDSKRGSASDVVKPDDWTAPDILTAMTRVKPTVLERAYHIIDLRSEEKEREYGDMAENCDHAAQIASIIQRKDFVASDVMAVLAALKLARHRRSYKQDSILDTVAYLGALDNLIQDRGDDRDW